MTGFVLLILLPAVLISTAGCYAMRQLAPRVGLIDKPGVRKVHQRPIALGGGLAIWLAIVLPLAGGLGWVWLGGGNAWVDRVDQLTQLQQLVLPHLDGIKHRTPELLFLLGCATVLMLLGLCDDRRGLPWPLRLGVQFLVAAAVVYWHGWKATVFVDLPWLTNVISVLWIVGMINSFNMLDNMNGLSAGVGAIAAGMLAALLLTAPDPGTQAPQLFIAGMLLLLVGSLLGFLWHNFPAARLFMGDAGSYLIGFLLAVLSILATFTGGQLPRHAVLAPLCILAVPLYDTITVLAIRLRAGKSPFEGDKNHLSHRLVELGLSPVQAVLTIWLLTLATGLPALVLHQVDTWGAALVCIAIASLLCVIAILESAARRLTRRASSRGNK